MDEEFARLLADHEKRIRALENKFQTENDDSDEDEPESDEEYFERLKEQQEKEDEDLVANCRCGAYSFNKKGELVTVADCICGA